VGIDSLLQALGAAGADHSAAAQQLRAEIERLEQQEAELLDYGEQDEEEEDDMYEEMAVGRRSWEEDYVLKQAFPALVPAFDPRPGRSNISQIQNFEVPPPGSEQQTGNREPVSPQPQLQPVKLELILRSADTEVLLEDGSRSVFHYVQLLHCRQLQQRPTDKLRRVWDNSYSLVYQERGAGTGKGWSAQFVSRHMGSERLPKGDVIQYLQKRAKASWLRKWRLQGSPKSIKKNKNCQQLVAAYKDFVNSEVHSASTAVQRVTETDHLSSLKDILSLLSLLYSYAQKEGDAGLDVSMEEFHSKKLRNKLVQQIHEPVVLASGALPDWCHTLTTYCSLLFPFEVREVFFASTALGMSR
jgi:E3 ubiquitin-protein ligase HECTD1